MTSPSRVRRLGAAIASPRAALAVAGDRREPGRAGTDLLAAFGLMVLAAQLVPIASAIWLAVTVDLGVGVRALLQVVSAFTLPLAVLVVAAAVIFAGAGARRDVGRAFDLACVAVVPLVVVVVVLVVLERELGIAVPELAASAIGYSWTCVLVGLAVVEARRTGPEPELAAGRARAAGVAFVALALASAAAQAVWIARHSDQVRPMKSGEHAPELALHVIGPHGKPGAVISLAQLRGRVVVIDFWATWCNPCLRALPHVDAFANRHPDIAVVAVAMDDPEGAREVFDQRGYRTIALVLDDGATSARFGVDTIPHTVVIDRDGVVRRVSRGAELDLDQAIAELK
ncbi:MAG TPA: TlpA disulfide reductase family protein [Kofleriaceae bacterium]|nr:TlpA disulfide reductase family protein [Kofleriaceae bacterium]